MQNKEPTYRVKTVFWPNKKKVTSATEFRTNRFIEELSF